MDIPWWGNCQMFITMKSLSISPKNIHDGFSWKSTQFNVRDIWKSVPSWEIPHCCESWSVCGCYMLLCVNFIPSFYICNWTNFSNFTFLFTILAWQSKTRENSSCHDLDNLLSTTLTSQVLNWVDTLFLGFL